MRCKGCRERLKVTELRAGLKVCIECTVAAWKREKAAAAAERATTLQPCRAEGAPAGVLMPAVPPAAPAEVRDPVALPLHEGRS